MWVMRLTIGYYAVTGCSTQWLMQHAHMDSVCSSLQYFSRQKQLPYCMPYSCVLYSTLAPPGLCAQRPQPLPAMAGYMFPRFCKLQYSAVRWRTRCMTRSIILCVCVWLHRTDRVCVCFSVCDSLAVYTCGCTCDTIWFRHAHYTCTVLYCRLLRGRPVAYWQACWYTLALFQTGW